MKVRCALREVPYDLLKDKAYETYQDTETNYRILNEFKTFKYYRKEDFVEVKEDKVMKIRQWEDLDGKTINGFEISVNDEWMTITKRNWYCMDIYYHSVPTSQIIAHLALLGIEVEFEKEPTITQNDYNWLVAMEVPYSKIVDKRFNDTNIIIDTIEIPYTSHLLQGLEKYDDITFGDLLKMKVEG
jgi:hypothetical protein